MFGAFNPDCIRPGAILCDPGKTPCRVDSVENKMVFMTALNGMTYHGKREFSIHIDTVAARLPF
jgi:hypothetical protein